MEKDPRQFLRLPPAKKVRFADDATAERKQQEEEEVEEGQEDRKIGADETNGAGASGGTEDGEGTKQRERRTHGRKAKKTQEGETGSPSSSNAAKGKTGSSSSNKADRKPAAAATSTSTKRKLDKAAAKSAPKKKKKSAAAAASSSSSPSSPSRQTVTARKAELAEFVDRDIVVLYYGIPGYSGKGVFYGGNVLQCDPTVTSTPFSVLFDDDEVVSLGLEEVKKGIYRHGHLIDEDGEFKFPGLPVYDKVLKKVVMSKGTQEGIDAKNAVAAHWY